VTRRLNKWPPAVWLAVYVSSLLVLMGSQRQDLGIVGLAMLLIAFGVAIYLAVRPIPGRPPPKGFAPLMAGLAAFYVVSAIAASESGAAYAFAALVAGTVPATAAVLTYATARRKTRQREDGDLEDLSVEDDSPFPGVGFDDRTPLGDSPELHDEVTPHDLPPDHPARHKVEERTRSGGGTTHGDGDD
jgi:hypothetical protein